MGRIYKILPVVIFLLLAFIPSPTPPPSGWYQQFVPNLGGRQITDVTFTDSLTGYIVTSRLTATDSSLVLKTINRGDNWFIIHSDSGCTYTRIRFINQNTGFIGGWISIYPYNYILKTNDAGINWSYINAPFQHAQDDMFPLNQDTIWIVDRELAFGGVFRTINGGASWQVQYQGLNPNKIYMYNKNIGFFSYYTGNALFRTTNCGENWIRVTGEDGFYDMRFSDNLTGWKAKGEIKKTTDGGLTWVQQTLPTGGNIITSSLNKLSVISRDTLWGIGGLVIAGSQTRGTVYRSINGGTNWLFQIPDTSIHVTLPYSYVAFINSKCGWAYTLGLMGGIHTTTGGDPIFYTGIQSISNAVPEKFILKQNYPNPFNPRTVIPYNLSSSAHVKIIAYDITGKEVQRMVDNYQQAGVYEVDFMGMFTATGVYFYRMEVDGEVVGTKKMILLK